MSVTKSFLTAFIILFSITSHAQLTAGLIAHWPFNGNLNDVTGNGHDATASMFFSGPPIPGYAIGMNGLANNSYNFKDSVMINAPYKPDLNLTKFSICVILKPRDLTWNASSGQGDGFVILERTHNGPMFPWTGFYRAAVVNSVALPGTNYQLVGVSNFANINTTNNVKFSNPQIDINHWYSLVVTFDGLEYKTYVNGVLKTSYLWDGTPIGTTTAGLNIGQYLDLYVFTTVSSQFKGLMDDLRLYNRPLTYAEVVQYPLTVKDTAVAFDNPIPDTAYKGLNMTVNYIVSKPFKSGNTFTVQLSDLSGSFASPTIVGSVTATAAGAITGNVLSSVTTGWHKMRIVATAPADMTLETDVYIKSPPPPSITIAANPSNTVPTTSNINFTATASNVASNALYQWKKNSTSISGANTNTFVANTGNTASGDTITAVVHSTSSAASDSATSNKIVITYTTTGGYIANVLNPDNIELYPNPNTGDFTLNVNNLRNGEIAIDVTNITGQVVYSTVANTINGTLKKQIGIKDVPNGVYTLNIKCADQKLSKRFTISK